jgi:hypothetical protein
MTDKFEKATARKATAEQVAEMARIVERIPTGLKLDRSRGSVVTVGERQWMFLMSDQAVANWKTLGSEDVVLGVLAYAHTGAAAPFVQRELVLVRRGGKLELQVRDVDEGVLWSGTAFVNRGGELEFSVPITRPTSSAKGVMKGKIGANGSLVLTDSRLPTPLDKKRPALARDE